MANIDLGNLTRYDGKIKQYAEDKYLSKNTANWQMTEKAGAVTCYPVPDTELEPIVDFSFKEVPPAEGDKSPSNPSTIEGVSGVNLTRCGKNLLQEYSGAVSSTKNDVALTINIDGTYTVNGLASADTEFNAIFTSLVVPQGQYKLSGCPSGGSISTYFLGASKGNYDLGNTFLIESNGVNGYAFWLTVKSGYNCQNLIFKPQLELGSIATEFEKPEFNIYNYSLGNTYYGGSVNLATGLMTVTWGQYVFIGQEGWNYSDLGSISQFYADILPSRTFSGIISPNTRACSHFSFDSSPSPAVNTFTTWASSNARVYFRLPASSYPDTTSLNAWLASEYAAEHPVTLAYSLNKPYTVQLTPIQIKSLFALDKNTPRLNTLYTDADSIQVGYQKHPARTAYELENAILALGGGE